MNWLIQQIRDASLWVWLALVAIASLTAVDVIRDRGIGAGSWVLGVAPNFIGVFALALAFVAWRVPARSRPVPDLRRIQLRGLLIACTGLIVWEFVQRTGNLVFDPWDLAATLAGGIAVGILFRVLPSGDAGQPDRSR